MKLLATRTLDTGPYAGGVQQIFQAPEGDGRYTLTMPDGTVLHDIPLNPLAVQNYLVAVQRGEGWVAEPSAP